VIAAGRRPAAVRVKEHVPSLRGKVDVHLRPSQEAADGQFAVRASWGEELVFRDVPINIPDEVRLHRRPARPSLP
jgi:hypothetical protein